MGAYDAQLRCSIGPSNFQLADWSSRATPRFGVGGERVGTTIEMSGVGWIEASTSADFATAVRNAQTTFNVSAQDITIFGYGGETEFQLVAAQCLSGGPHVQFEILPQLEASRFKKNVRFTVSAEQGLITGGGLPIETQSIESAVRPDGLRVVTYRGELNRGSASTYFLNIILPAIRNLFADYVISYRYETNLTDSKLNYEVVAEQMFGPLPEGSSVLAVDGEHTFRSDRDENNRKIAIFAFDLLVVGDAFELVNILRPTDQTILRESYEITRFREQRLRVEFTTIDSSENDFVTEWDASIELSGEADAAKAVEYPGVDPVLYRPVKGAIYVSFTGRAIALEKFVKPPPVPDFPLAEKTSVRYGRRGNVERETNWNYRFVFATADDAPQLPTLLGLTVRPTQFEYVTV